MAGSGSPQKDASDLSGSDHKKHKAASDLSGSDHKRQSLLVPGNSIIDSKSGDDNVFREYGKQRKHDATVVVSSFVVEEARNPLGSHLLPPNSLPPDRLPFVPPPPPPPPPYRIHSLPRFRVKGQTSLLFSPLSLEQERQLKEYHKEVHESDGFDVSFVPYIRGMIFPFHPVTIDNTPGSLYVDLIASATLAIYHYNHRETPKRDFEFSKLLKATFTPAAGYSFSITFEATEQGRLGGPAAINTFQTVVYCRFDYRLQVEFCRLMDENKKKSGMTDSTSPTTADWRSRDLEKRNHEPYSFDCTHSLDDLDVKTAATVAMFILYDPKKTEYMFSKLVSAFSTTTDGARIFNITFEATDRDKDRNVVRTFEAVVWQIYPSFNLEIEYSRLKNEEEGAFGLDA